MNHLQPPVRSSGLAVASLVLGIIGLCVIPLGFLAVIFGHLALRGIKRSGGTMGGQGLAVGGLVTGYMGSLVAAVAIAGVVSGILAGKREKEEATQLFPVVEASLPLFPEPGEMQEVGEMGVRFYDVSTKGEGPGQSMQFRVYLPPGDIAPGTLPCVLVPPAGSNLLSGLSLDGSDYHDETLPYAEAGMVVVSYSIDGAVEDEESEDDLEEAYKAFRKAGAGVINGRNAFEFAKQKIPQVDPQKIYSAGHSSAGTISLLLASHLPELAGAVAYAPVCNVEEHYAELAEEPFVSMIYPGLSPFTIRSSPVTHVDAIEVPLFLFFAKDDERVRADDGRAFARSIEDRGGDASVRVVSEGGHYQSMIDDGIPLGIEWIESH